jgi:hypothetical protein
MPDQEQAQPTAGNAVRTLDPELSRQLIALGFDPKTPIFVADGWFTHTAINRALFMAGRPGPVILEFGATDWETEGLTHEQRKERSWLAPVLVDRVTAQFETDTRAGDDHRKVPEFYIRGFLTKTATDSAPDAPRVHVLVDTHDYDDPPNETAYVQVVHEPSPPDPDALLEFGEGVPKDCPDTRF